MPPGQAVLVQRTTFCKSHSIQSPELPVYLLAMPSGLSSAKRSSSATPRSHRQASHSTSRWRDDKTRDPARLTTRRPHRPSQQSPDWRPRVPTSPDRHEHSTSYIVQVTPPAVPLHSYASLDEDIQSSIEPMAEVILAIDLRAGQTMGCAFFETDNGSLQLCMDIPLSDLNVAEQLLTQIQPTTVLVPARAPENLLAFLDARASSEDQDGPSKGGFILRARSTSDFSPRMAHDRLIALQSGDSLDADRAFSSADELLAEAGAGNSVDLGKGCESHNIKLIQCGTSVDLESKVSVSCAGAVLNEINRRRASEYLPDGEVSGRIFEVLALKTFSLFDSVFVTQETMLCLQVVQSEQHPNSQISGGVQSASGSKESLSIYGLFHQLAGTPQGRLSLRRLLLRPTQNIEVITARHDFISILSQPLHAEHMTDAHKALRKMGNARRVLAQLQKGAESPSTGQSVSKGAWSTLVRFAKAALDLRNVVRNITGYANVSLLAKVVESIDLDVFSTVGDMIDRTIDFEDSSERHRSCVRTGVDPQLDELKRHYDGMSDLLTQVVDHIRTRIPAWARLYVRSCIFLPQLGFLTTVACDPATGLARYEGEGLEDDQWEKIFTSDGVACYKNQFMRELDEQYGDMYCKIGDREVEIIYELARQILKYEHILSAASDLCGQFDALLALALGARRYNWTRPQMSDDDGVQIIGGRHPLQELVVPCFIPNDCHLATDSWSNDDNVDRATIPRALVLTGPNHSGKSVFLKQVATIVYLAHVGSYVPAEHANIGLTDKILTRISTRESVSRVESAFAIDLKQVAQAMKGATARSLVLVDEFGKGTNPDDGAGLFTALIDYFLQDAAGCPKILLATHFHEVFEGGYLSHLPKLQVAHMEVEIDKVSQGSSEQLAYLFKLAPGHSPSSFGGRCAALSGVSRSVVRRAEAIARLIARHEDLATACSQLSMKEEQRLERAESAARLFVESDLEIPLATGGTEGVAETQGKQLKWLLKQILGSSELACGGSDADSAD